MQGTVWLRYLIGNESAIREVAATRSSFWTGLILVLLTAFARSYDQTFIGENPLRWFLGPLVFSFFSGSWLYIVVFGAFARSTMADADGKKPPFWSGWRVFMSLFWMTAPVAWLYAIPVERFLAPVEAAKANLVLLSLVSLWRVLLMTRVLQCLFQVPFLAVLSWVLFGAAVEALVVFFFGGGFARVLMASMGGMRNSPAEEVLLRGLGNAFSIALLAAPCALVIGIIYSFRCSATAFEPQRAGRIPWLSLGAVGVFWIAVSVAPQLETRNSAAVERLVAAGKSREALDYMVQRQPADFAPARVLPPRPFEREFFNELPACFGVVSRDDPPWVRRHLMTRLSEMLEHYGPRWGRHKPLDTFSRDERIKRIGQGIGWLGPKPRGWAQLLDGLERIPEGRGWILTNAVVFEGLHSHVQEQLTSKDESPERPEWTQLLERIGPLVSTNALGM